MTTIEMEVILMKYFNFLTNTIVPNVTRNSGLVKFETDLLVLSKSNYATGVEIKISKADLLNDLKKAQYGTPSTKGEVEWLKKYWYSEFKHFYYAVPSDLVEIADKTIHPFCGLISISENKKVSIIRKPKLIKNYRWTDKEKDKLVRLGCLRVYNLKKNLIGCKK